MDDVDVYLDEGVQEQFDEQEHIPRGDATRRIAIVNCDWENTSAQDLFALLHAVLPEEGKLIKVSIHPSQFGVERMHLEEVEGMPKDLWKKEVHELVEVIEDTKLTDPNWIPTFTVISDEKLKEVNPDFDVKKEELDEMEEDEDIDPYTNEKISKSKKFDDDFDYVSVDESDFEDYDEEDEEELEDDED